MSRPIVAVGSLTRGGGTGVTPTVIALAQKLSEMQRNVHVVTTGAGTPRSIAYTDRAEEVGDEPLLIAAFAPTWTAADLAMGARAAIDAGAEVVIIDGGLPDSAVRADLGVLVESAVRGFGNGRAWPLGPLKIARDKGLSQADVLITLGPMRAQTDFESLPIPRVAARLEPLQTGMDWTGARVFAFAGIGVPERFFATLNDLGAEVVGKQALADHQDMTPALLTRLAREAAMLGAQMVTTEKDAVRLPPELRPHVLVVPVRLVPEDWTSLEVRLARLFT
ncbi:tetraacyldisaccharide 4'-kinase [Maritimibacter sp. DP1N21-5]|uniref:tetraacyldisaccharide 4'-kinase n=1 Tax=Maritimibacter sp. DP1N21-5 TaxID=2836867 RepID=UPI00351CBAB5